ncbi:MAG: hypothetical protein Q8861_13205 [Bacteroidota bacterium]|nr:hypothetical protein [Bacteroidota bacterium]
MKIKYETSKAISKETISKHAAISKIKNELEKLKADNIVIENDRITFKNNANKWGNRNSLMKLLDDGSITFDQLDDNIKISFVGYYSVLTEIILYIVGGGILAILINAWFSIFCIGGAIGIFLKRYFIIENCNILLSELENNNSCP